MPINLLPEGIEPKEKLGWVMDSILAAVVEEFEFNDESLPDLRYITFGPDVPHDCEQLTVTMVQTYLGPPGDQAVGPQRCDGPRTGVFQVELVRCYKDGSSKNKRTNPTTTPDPIVMSEYTRERSVDVWLMLNSIERLADYNGAIADVSIGVPSDYQGVIMNLVVQI